MSDDLGVSTGELAYISSMWRNESSDVNGMSWSSFGDTAGSGSDVLAAVRDIESSAGKAMSSISKRLSDMAGLVDKFSTNVEAQDEQTGAAFTELKPR